MAVPYSDFFPEVIPLCPDVSEPQALHAIRNACIEFCERTSMWRESAQALVQTGQNTYFVPVNLDTASATILSVYYDNNLLVATSEESLNNNASRDWRLDVGTPTMFTSAPDTASFTLSRVPPDEDNGKVMRIRYALRPTRDSEEVGLDYIYSRWAEVIGYGALQRLYMTMGQPYYNPQVAVSYGNLFAAGVAKARAEVNNGNGQGQLMVKPRPFARGRTVWR